MINTSLQKIPGFEATDYAYSNGRIVWAGKEAGSLHPRNYFSPWQAQISPLKPSDLIPGSLLCESLFSPRSHQKTVLANSQPAKGLLMWLVGHEMPFPMSLSAKKFDAIEDALRQNDIHTFEHAAQQVLGLGNGLTPSGDDFVGGIFFALAHAPRQAWKNEFTSVKQRLRIAAMQATNVISAALLDDMMEGKSFSALHDLLQALQSQDETRIKNSCDSLLRIGASSGADMLAGVLLALNTHPEQTANLIFVTKH